MATFSPQSTDEIGINTIRILAADVVGKANSGHPVSAKPIYRLARLSGCASG